MKRGLLREYLDDPRELTARCLERIRNCDGEIQAWVEVSLQPALREGPLSGIPFGAKDIFETCGMATEYGSPIYSGRKGSGEAALVTALRERGAILLGKTQTTAFAYYDPAPTRNPRDLARTPGGSSSGSAAAVAAGMAAFALGSQTQGSVIRPASYCRVAGFKSTYGLLPLDGVLAFAPSLDTAGLFTQTADDMALLWERLGYLVAGAPAVRLAKTRLGIPDGVEERLRAYGWPIKEIELPFDFDEVLRAVKTVNAYEGSRTHEARWREFGDRIGAKLALLVCEGLSVAQGRYEDALEFLRLTRARMISFYAKYPVVLTPAATGPPPMGLASTGDPRMNAPWTGLHGPAFSVPCGEIGLQLTAAPGADALLVATAAAIESVPGILGECPIPLR